MKVNKAGRECPAWCDTDHENGLSYTCSKNSPSVDAGNTHAWTWADLPNTGQPEAGVSAAGEAAVTLGFADSWSARNAAALIEGLAGFSPEEHREIAAHLRESAAQAFGEAEAG